MVNINTSSFCILNYVVINIYSLSKYNKIQQNTLKITGQQDLKFVQYEAQRENMIDWQSCSFTTQSIY